MKTREVYHRRRAAGECVRCGSTPRPSLLHCDVCLEKVAGWSLKRRYGITPVDYARLLVEQDGVCAICKKVPKGGPALAVDHDHVTGAVRGLLCGPCNLALGGFEDDPTLLQAAVAYLLAPR